MTKPEPKDEKLTEAEAAAVHAQVGEVMATGLPLAEGLRAAAEEFSGDHDGRFRLGTALASWIVGRSMNRLGRVFFGRDESRIRRALLRIASDVSGGESITDALDRRRIPGELHAFMSAGISSEATAIAIGEYSAHSSSSSQLRGHLLFLFAYPILVLSLASGTVGIFFNYLVPSARAVFDDFGVELPALTQLVFGISDLFVQVGPLIAILGPTIFAALVIGFFLVGGRTGRRLITCLPLFGSGFRDLAIARMSHVLAVLLRHEAPLPEALRAAGIASREPGIERTCGKLADRVGEGEGLPVADPGLSGFPLGFIRLTESGSNRQTVAEALHSVARTFENRARTVLSLFATIVHPIVLIGVCGLITLCFFSLMQPILKLLGSLN